jgi:beta-glucosidase
MTRDTAERSADYARIVAERLADRIPLWITPHEPFVVTALGYALGMHAPGKALMLDVLATAHHQLLGHGLVAAALRAAGAPQVAITSNYSPAWPPSDNAADAAACDTLRNRMFTDPVLAGRYPDLSEFGIGPGGLECVRDGDLDIISAPLDAPGVNYYNPTRLSALPGSPLPFQPEPIDGCPVTHFGWPVIPA